MPAVAPPPASTDTSFEAGLGAALSDAYDSAVGGGEPAETPVEASPDETEWTGEAPAEGADTSEQVSPSAAIESPAEASATSPATPPQPGAVKEPYQLTQDGKHYMVPKSELANLSTVRQYWDGVSKFFQTPEQAQSAYSMSSDLQMMQNDWLNGSDASIDAMLNHWAGANYADNPVMQQRFSSSFAKMAQRAPQILKSTNPTAYKAMIGNIAKFNGTVGADGQIQWGDAVSPASGLALDLVNQAYEQAAQSQNALDLRRAQELDFAITGTYKDQLPKLDPQAEQRATFEREQAAFRAQQTKMEANVTNAWSAQNVEGLKFKLLNQEIESIMSPWKAKSNVSDAFYNDIKAGILRDLVGEQSGTLGGKLAAMDPEWAVLHEQEFRALVNEFRQGWQNDPHGQRLQARVQPYVQSFLSRAKRLIPSLAKARIEAKRPTASAPARRPAAAPAATPPQNPANGRVSTGDWQDRWNEEWKKISAAS